MRNIAEAMNPKMILGGAKKPGTHFDSTVYQTTHISGGAIMGDDPKTSAVNRYLQSWDVPNVFVPGASAFPQGLGYNPTGMVAALRRSPLSVHSHHRRRHHGRQPGDQRGE